MIRSEGSRNIIKGLSWLFVERVLRLGVVLVTGIYVARYLGDTIFGHLNYATGFVGLFFALGSAGIDDILVRDLVKYPEKRNELLGTGAMIKLFGAILMVICATLGAILKDMDGLTVALIVVISSAELLRPFTVIDHWFMAEMKARRSAIAQIVQVVASSSAKFALVGAMHFGYLTPQGALIWFAWVYVIENTVLAAAYLIVFARAGGNWREWRSTGPMVRYLLRESWPMLIYGMALYIQARIDQVMIKDMLTQSKGEDAAFAEVGQYSVALRMIEALSFPTVILVKSLAPAINKARERSQALYKDRLLNQYRLMFLTFLAMGIPLYLIAEPVITFFFGEEFRPAGFLLALFSIRLFFTNMGMGKGSFIVNESLFKYSLFTAVVGATTNIAVNWLMIPLYASKGAIIATMISFTMHIFVIDLFVPRMRENLGLMMKGIFTFWRFHRAT